MSSGSNLAIAGLISASLLAIASPSFAATVKVVEAGEGGGEMSAVLKPSRIKAGPTVFQVSNDAATANHEMIVVRLKSANEKISVNPRTHKVDEGNLSSLGEVSGLKPGQSGELKADLKPGTYLVFCNYKGHYEAGMAARLTVTK